MIHKFRGLKINVAALFISKLGFSLNLRKLCDIKLPLKHVSTAVTGKQSRN